MKKSKKLNLKKKNEEVSNEAENLESESLDEKDLENLSDELDQIIKEDIKESDEE